MTSNFEVTGHGGFPTTAGPKSAWGKCNATERRLRSDLLEARVADSSPRSMSVIGIYRQLIPKRRSQLRYCR